MCFAVAQPPCLPSHKYLRDECCLGCNYLTQAMSWWNECLGSISLMECRSVGPGMWEWRWEPERRPGGLFPWTGVMTSEAARELNSSFSSAHNMAWGTHRAYCLGSLHNRCPFPILYIFSLGSWSFFCLTSRYVSDGHSSQQLSRIVTGRCHHWLKKTTLMLQSLPPSVYLS